METTETRRVTPEVSTGDWVVTILIASIPLVNIIMLFVWGFGSSTNPNKSNWAKAMLIWIVIGIVFWVLFGAIFGFALFSGMGGSDWQQYD